MEILFVSHKYPPSVGGMEKQSFELINGMRQFAKVHTIVYDGSGSKLLFFIFLQKKIRAALRAHPGIAVIHFNDALIATMCLWHRGYRHVKRVVTVHGLDVVFPVGLYQNSIIPRFNQFDLVIAVSRATADACIARGIDPAKVVVVNNGVDTDIPQIKTAGVASHLATRYGIEPGKKKTLVSIGRPVRRKGFSWFIREVMPGLRGEFQYLMIGPYSRQRTWGDRLLALLPAGVRERAEFFFGLPSDENEIRSLLAQGTADVRHLGKVPAEDLGLLLHAADAFVMPNIPVAGDMEGFGLVCLEASLHGKLVIAADIEGITDAIRHGENGILVPAGNASAWVTAIRKVLAEAPAKTLTGEAGRAYTLAHFGWEKMALGYYAAFENLFLIKIKNSVKKA